MVNGNQILNKLKENRKYILAAALLVFVVGMCDRLTQTEENKDGIELISVNSDKIVQGGKDGLKSIENIYQDRYGNDSKKGVQGMNLLPLLLFGLFAVVLVILKKRGWLDKIMPKMIVFMAGPVKGKRKGLWKFVIANHRKESVTFFQPVIVFSNLRETRKFKIKNKSGGIDFPLVLTPGTGHKLVFELEKFYSGVQDLTMFKFVRIEIESSTGKKYRSMLRWVNVNKIIKK